MAHIHELIDNTVAAYIVQGKSVLLINHKKLKRWLPIGGHVELNENPEEALFREIEEESGIKKEDLEVFGKKPEVISEGTTFLYAPIYLDIHRISETHHHIGMTYFLRSKTDQIELAEGEHSDIRWVDLAEIEKGDLDLLPAVTFYATEAISLLGT